MNKKQILYPQITQITQIECPRGMGSSQRNRIHKHAKEAVNAFAEGDEQRAMLMGARRFTKTQPLNTKELRRLVAAKMVEKGKYPY